MDSAQLALVGIDDLDTDKCKPPCQMRRIISIEDPGFNATTHEMNIAIATLESPIFYSKEVDGIPMFSLRQFLPFISVHSNYIWITMITMKAYQIRSIPEQFSLCKKGLGLDSYLISLFYFPIRSIHSAFRNRILLQTWMIHVL